jgi:exonuclease VII small subunit
MLARMDTSADSPSAANGTAELTERVRRLEDQLAALTEAVEVLARGLESSPMAEPRNRHIEEAARQAHELLLLAKSAAPGTRPGEGGASI